MPKFSWQPIKTYKKMYTKQNKMNGAERLCAFLYGFVVFFPYPAIPVGNYSGIQLAHMVTIAFIVIYAHAIAAEKKVTLGFVALILPPIVSLVPDLQNTMNINATLNLVVALSVMLVASQFSKASFPNLLWGGFVAIGIHAAVGVLQQIAYMGEQFPFLDLYINPSFATIDDGVTWRIYAIYTKRSFGLLPEPSAMFACVAPWLVILGSMVMLPEKFEWNTRMQYRVACWLFFAGIVLIFLGRSGGTPSLLLALMPALWTYVLRVMKSGSVRGIFILLGLLVFAAVAGDLVFQALQERALAEAEEAGSWDERSASILYGLQSIFEGEPLEVLFGYGLGMVSPLTTAATGASSVHSWVVGYFMGTGLFGAAVLVMVLVASIISIQRSGNRLLGYCVFFVWLVCATIVTGYIQLLPMWAMFGVILNWGKFYPVDGAGKRGPSWA